MAPRWTGHWKPRRRTRRRAVPYPLVVAAVAIAAFYATLNWPDDGFGPDASGRASAGSTITASPQPRSPGVPDRASLSCQVSSITDGDTLRCRDGVRIRLHAVAARERDGSCSPGHPCPAASAEAATAELRRLASGKTLRCQPTGETYNRIAAICWTPSGEEVNCAMIRSETAVVWERFNRETPLCRG